MKQSLLECEKQVLLLEKDQIDTAAEVLGRAFQTYPLWSHVFPDASQRKRKLKHVLRVPIQYGFKYGEVYTTSEELEGIAVWLPPYQFPMTLLRQLRCISLSFLLKVTGTVIKKYFPIEDYINNTHMRLYNQPHWYLQPIGIDPIHQGKGFGTTLINSMIERIKEENQPIYLETHTEYNVNFYKNLGFRVLEESLIPNTEIKQWAMLNDFNMK